MGKNETNVSIKYIAKLHDIPTGNRFSNIPEDIQCFLHSQHGSMIGMVERLYPDQEYEIKISIRSVKPKI